MKSTFITNAFSLNMIEEPVGKYEIMECNWEEVRGYMALLNKYDTNHYKGVYINIVNAFGHDKSIPLLKNNYGVEIKFNRISVNAKRGDTIIVLQYRGERLPEGATELPEGAEIVPLKILIN